MGALARAQPNIALIKYWGKRDTDRNLPATGSISITLDELFTEMEVEFSAELDEDRLTVNAAESPRLQPRVSQCLDVIIGTDRPRAHVISRSNFPIAAGLASSASAFAALVLAASTAAGRELSKSQLAEYAGRASGSAARSLYGGFVELSNQNDHIAVSEILAGNDWPLRIVAAVTTAAAKPVSSTQAMEISRRTSPFYRRWVDEQAMDLATARDAIAIRDFGKLASIAEHNCLKMHSVMWASRPPIVYWNAATVECLDVVRQLQREDVAVFFTIDAGPQVKAICPPDHEQAVIEALAQVPGVDRVLTSGIGAGAKLVIAP